MFRCTLTLVSAELAARRAALEVLEGAQVGFAWGDTLSGGNVVARKCEALLSRVIAAVRGVS